MTTEVLPDSRARNHTGAVYRGGAMWIPVFCANCGVEGGMCPEENMNFLFYQCYKCAETYGEIANTLSVPDQVFYEKLRDEQLESYGHFLTEQELVSVVQEDASSLATLLKSGR